MNIEQTTQLIQLILNSGLMVLTCVLLLSGLRLRQFALEQRFQRLTSESVEWRTLSLRSQHRIQTKKQLRQVRQRVQCTRQSLLAAHYTLLLFMTSTFLLALRTLVDWGGLISIALTLFVCGSGLFLITILWLLVDAQGDRALLTDVQASLSQLNYGMTAPKRRSTLQRSAPRPSRSQQRALPPSSGLSKPSPVRAL